MEIPLSRGPGFAWRLIIYFEIMLIFLRHPCSASFQPSFRLRFAFVTSWYFLLLALISWWFRTLDTLAFISFAYPD